MEDPCARVRRTCAAVVARSRSVKIAHPALLSFAAGMRPGGGASLPTPPSWTGPGASPHYDDDAASGGPLTAQYVFVLDALNFCFWPSTTHLEYDDLAGSLTAVLRADSTALDADRLVSLTAEELTRWFAPHHMPAMEDRLAKLHELGAVLAAGFGGRAANLLAAAGGDAAAAVDLVTRWLPSFRDETLHDGRQVFFYKRAQIVVGDAWAAYRGAGPASFSNTSALTAFADYRLPQLLRARGVLVYTPALAAKVDARVELPAGGEEEVEIRAATVVAVEGLRVALGGGLLSAQIDWLIWHEGEQMKESLAPHHRVVTPFY